MGSTRKQQLDYLKNVPLAMEAGKRIWPGLIMSAERINAIKVMEVDPSDIFIATYPKSGTTWTCEIVSAMVHDADTDVLKNVPQEERCEWLEFDKDHWWVSSYYSVKNLFRRFTGDHSAERRRRVIFTHLPVEMLPQQVLDGKCRLICVARNPKDTAVSFFHHHRISLFLGGQEHLPWDDFCALFRDGHVYAGSWHSHVLGYWRHVKAHQKHTLFIKYEELKGDLEKQVREIAFFLDIKLEDAQIAAVTGHCSFEAMRTNPKANRSAACALFNQRVSPFMRQGKVGDWRNYFTVAQDNNFDFDYKQRMANSGLLFDFH